MKEQLALYGAMLMAFVAGHLEKPPIPSEPVPSRSIYNGGDFYIARVTLDTFAIMAQGPEDQAPFALSLATAHLALQNCIPTSARIVQDEIYKRSLVEIIVLKSDECFPELSPFLTNN